jgi:rhodanese-related sulfurtransferase
MSDHRVRRPTLGDMPATSSPHPRRRSLALAAAAVLTLAPLAACSDDGEQASAAATDVASGVPAATLALEEQRTAIDVRTPEEYEQGHVQGSANLDIRDAGFAEAIASLDPDGAYVVYCRSGNRSAQATNEMRALGLEVIDGGALTDMEDAGWPLA